MRLFVLYMSFFLETKRYFGLHIKIHIKLQHQLPPLLINNIGSRVGAQNPGPNRYLKICANQSIKDTARARLGEVG